VCSACTVPFSVTHLLCYNLLGSKAGIGSKGYYRCRQIIATNLGKHRLTRHLSALPANPTSSRPWSWSLGNATSVVEERSGWRRVLGASKPRPSAKGAHRYRKRACVEALRLATTKLTQRGTGYPSWGHPTQLRITRGSTGLIASSCNSGDGTDQRVQSLMFMIMNLLLSPLNTKRRLLYLNTQFLPRSKHFSSRI